MSFGFPSGTLTIFMGIQCWPVLGVSNCLAIASLWVGLVRLRMVREPSSLITIEAPGCTSGPLSTACRSSFTFHGVTGCGYVSLVANTCGQSEQSIIFLKKNPLSDLIWSALLHSDQLQTNQCNYTIKKSLNETYLFCHPYSNLVVIVLYKYPCSCHLWVDPMSKSLFVKTLWSII